MKCMNMLFGAVLSKVMLLVLLLPVHQSSLLLRLRKRSPSLLLTCYHLQQANMMAQQEKYRHAISRLTSQAMLFVLLLSLQALQLLRLLYYLPIFPWRCYHLQQNSK